MKTRILLVALLLAAATVSAGSLTVVVRNVRSDKGSVLLMAQIPGVEKPVYQMAAAKAGTVVAELYDLTGGEVEVSVFHDENGNFKMDRMERSPVEGYVRVKCALPEEQNETEVVLTYPSDVQLLDK